MRRNRKNKRKYRLKPLHLEITSARELSTDVVERVKKIFGEDIPVKTTIDKELIGGIKIKLGEAYFDGTVVKLLEDMQTTLIKEK